jgi:hypothetical protein
MILESPKALAIDGSAAMIGALVFLKLVPALTGLGALVLIVLRIMLAIREWRRG